MESFIKNLAKGAGKILRDGFHKKKNVVRKSSIAYDIVTSFDVKAEKFICGRIKRKFPNHTFVAEETFSKLVPSKNFWIIDPIDGTNAFARGLAQFSTSIAFVSNNVLRFGVVYDPIADKMFYAQKGKGATLNDRRIHVSDRRTLAGALGAYGWNDKFVTAEMVAKDIKALIKNSVLPTILCSSAMHGAYTACGAMDLMIDRNAYPWDYAGAAIILQESGAKVTDFKNSPFKWNSRNVLAANHFLHGKILPLLK